MAWTNEQKEAIYTEGTNIIVSAGAGSGKTAVLTERVLEKVKKGISVDNLLILTFTKMAAKEMKERIGDKLKKEGLTSELAKLDTADITTFDAYALSVVKKYHYYLNVSKDINIIDESVITLYKRKILKDIFEELYEENNHEFIDFIQEYCIKDDKDIFEFILNINSKLDLKTNKREYLDNYINTVYDEVKIDNDIDNYIKVILRLISNINDYLEYIDDYTNAQIEQCGIDSLLKRYRLESITEFRGKSIYSVAIDSPTGKATRSFHLKGAIVNDLLDSLKRNKKITKYLYPPKSPRVDLDNLHTYYRGNLKSEVSVIIISDFDCESCINAHSLHNSIYEEYKDKVQVYFSVDSLDYLYKGGRISGTKAAVGSLLNIKPILNVKDGLVVQKSQVRGKKQIFTSLVNSLVEKYGDDLTDRIIFLGCGDNKEDLETLRETLLKHAKVKNVYDVNIGCVICSHSGPGVIGISCM